LATSSSFLEWSVPIVKTEKIKKGTTKRPWEIPQNSEPPKNGLLPPFSASLNEFDDRLADVLLPTDSRRRLDRLFLEKGDYDTATYWKKVMEDRQRVDRKKRKNEWTPLWFKQIDDDTHETKRMWVYSGDYWEQRQKKVTLLDAGAKKEASELLFPEKVVGLACNFMAYNTPSKTSNEPDSSSETKNNEDLNTILQTTQSIEKTTSDESPSTVTLKEENNVPFTTLYRMCYYPFPTTFSNSTFALFYLGRSVTSQLYKAANLTNCT